MANKHIKTINGKKYYYESIRKGDKVTSRYLGPVEERVRKEKNRPTKRALEKPVEITEELKEKEEIREEDLETADDSYIG